MPKILFSFIIIAVKKIIGVLLLIGVVCFAWYRLSLRPVDAANETRIQVDIPEGTSTRGIAEILEEQGIIRSSKAFLLYARLHRTERGLQAGTFFLTPAMAASEVVQALGKGSALETTVTIPEGFTIKDIDALVAKKGLAKPGEVLACAQSCDFSGFEFLPRIGLLPARGSALEGYLFPDSYFVTVEGFEPQEFLERLLKTFEDRVVVGLASDIQASGRPLHEIVTMASLVEEETRTAAERPVVAGILWKRFDAGIGLGVDAAVRYILNKPTAAITQSDLNIDSPYNLRKYAGLPPGPIASPGLGSIKATLHPEASAYYYYLHGTDGQIRYAVTNDEHNANRAKYLR